MSSAGLDLAEVNRSCIVATIEAAACQADHQVTSLEAYHIHHILHIT